MKFSLENVSRDQKYATLSMHRLIMHALRGNIPYLCMLIGDSVSSSITFSLSVVVGINLQVIIVPDSCGAMQFPVGKLTETIEGMLLI